jgi:hypothetical protein
MFDLDVMDTPSKLNVIRKTVVVLSRVRSTLVLSCEENGRGVYETIK